MARKKRRSTRRRGGHHRKRRSARSRHHSGGGRGLALVKRDIPDLLIAGVYGKLEALAGADANFVLNKVPRPVVQLGYTGGTALALYALTYLSSNPWLKRSASVVATIAMYKMGKTGKLYTSSGTDSIGELAASPYGVSDEHVIEEHVMGALDAEAYERAPQRSSGVPFDPVVNEAGGRV